MAHWVGPETLICLIIKGYEVNALADSGSQVKTITPGYVWQHKFPVLPLEALVDHPLNLMGLGGRWKRLLGFVILLVQVKGIAGYDKDIVLLVVPDK